MAGTDGERAHRDSSLSSVGNAARLLREFVAPVRSLGVTELARRLGISKSTAHRLLHTLSEEGLLTQDPATGAYLLSTEMFILGSSVPGVSDVRAAASPVLEQLRGTTRETVEVVMRSGSRVIAVARREGQPPRSRLEPIGRPRALLGTSGGLVLAAHLPAAQLSAAVADATATEFLATGRAPAREEAAGLLSLFDRVRSQGWADSSMLPVDATAADDADTAANVAIAAPVCNASGEVVAAVSVIAPHSRLDRDDQPAFIRMTVEAGLAMSRRLGHRDAGGAAP